MAIEYIRPVSHTARWARRLGWFALLILVAGWAAIRFGPLIEPHFLALYALALALGALAALGGLVGIFSLWRIGAKGGKASVAAIFLAMIVAAPAGAGYWLYRSFPQIYEVSTDIATPPPWIAEPAADQFWLGARAPAGQADRDAQTLAYPALIPHRYDASIDKVVESVREVADDRRIRIRLEKLPPSLTEPPDEPTTPGAIPIPAPRPDAIPQDVEPDGPRVALMQGVYSERITGFPFDVVIRLREDADATIADVRVAARYGRSDLSESSRIAAKFLEALDESVADSGDDN